MSDLDSVYERYNQLTNVNCFRIKKWKQDPCSKKASVGRTAINRNIRLQCKPKRNWTKKDIRDAKKAISYLSRAKRIKSTNLIEECGRTRNSIALMNWAFDDKKSK